MTEKLTSPPLDTVHRADNTHVIIAGDYQFLVAQECVAQFKETTDPVARFKLATMIFNNTNGVIVKNQWAPVVYNNVSKRSVCIGEYLTSNSEDISAEADKVSFQAFTALWDSPGYTGTQQTAYELAEQIAYARVAELHLSDELR